MQLQNSLGFHLQTEIFHGNFSIGISIPFMDLKKKKQGIEHI